MIEHEQNLDMTPGEPPFEIRLNQNDTDFRLVLHLFSSLGALTLESGTTAEIRGRDADGLPCSENAAIDLVTKTVTVESNAFLTRTAGAGTYEICLTHDGKALHSANFHIVVESSGGTESYDGVLAALLLNRYGR